jgi:hypothetical protein
MRTAQHIAVGLAAAGLAGLLAACSGGSGAPTGVASNASSGTGGSDNRPRATAPNGASPGSGTVRVRCEVRPGRSKISVDGNDLSPRNGTFSARVTSGANSAASGTQTAIGDEAEFDFDSATEVGAVRIPANFIVGGAVTGEIVNAGGQVVASGTAQCV